MSQVVVIGSWHLGSVIGTCLAEIGHQVHLWDQNESVRKSWQSGKAPIRETGLDEIIAQKWQKNLYWAEDLGSAAASADWIILAYDTPINDQDEIVLETVEQGFQTLLRCGFSKTARFFFTSQLPVGTSRKFRRQILEVSPHWCGFVTYQPENLRLGEAIHSFRSPDRMVLGVDQLESDAPVKEFQALIQNQTTPINVMSLESAEMVKHALNSFLATCVVFANEVSEICEKSGADAWAVMSSLKQDSRVGPKAFLRPGLGFAGGTLARDVQALRKLSGKSTDQNFFTNLYHINESRNHWILAQIQKHLGTLKEKRIVLLGVTYKPFTSTVRRSPALQIAQLLSDAGARCVAIDPMADLDELAIEQRQKLPFIMESNIETAFSDAHAAVLITEWPQFKELNWSQLQDLMQTKLVIDTKNQLVENLRKTQITHVVPGKPGESL